MRILILDFAVFSEKQGNAPDTCESNYSINNSADNCGRTTECPRYKVELKKTHKTPVKRTDNYENQANFIKH